MTLAPSRLRGADAEHGACDLTPLGRRRSRSWWPEAIALLQAGETCPAVAERLGVSHQQIWKVRERFLPEMATGIRRPPLRRDELAEIERGVLACETSEVIAARLGRAGATIRRRRAKLRARLGGGGA